MWSRKIALEHNSRIFHGKARGCEGLRIRAIQKGIRHLVDTHERNNYYRGTDYDTKRRLSSLPKDKIQDVTDAKGGVYLRRSAFADNEADVE